MVVQGSPNSVEKSQHVSPLTDVAYKGIYDMSTQLMDSFLGDVDSTTCRKSMKPFPESPLRESNVDVFKIPPPIVESDRRGCLVYNDPEEASAKRKLMESLGQSSKKIRTEDTVKRFMISSVTSKERSESSQIIRKLGGVILSGDGWDQSCTHLICGKPSKTGFL